MKSDEVLFGTYDGQQKISQSNGYSFCANLQTSIILMKMRGYHFFILQLYQRVWREFMVVFISAVNSLKVSFPLADFLSTLYMLSPVLLLSKAFRSFRKLLPFSSDSQSNNTFCRKFDLVMCMVVSHTKHHCSHYNTELRCHQVSTLFVKRQWRHRVIIVEHLKSSGYILYNPVVSKED